jgi:hypothetical protein
MKLLFLDIDGVIINRRSSKIRYDNPDADCVARLNHFIEQSGAKIVVIDAWRMGRSVDELQQILDGWGVQGVVAGKTPQGPHRCQRGDEIGAFLRDWQGEKVNSFVILSDDADFGQFLRRLVHTRFESGLTPNDSEMAIRVMKNTGEPHRFGARALKLESL